MPWKCCACLIDRETEVQMHYILVWRSGGVRGLAALYCDNVWYPPQSLTQDIFTSLNCSSFFLPAKDNSSILGQRSLNKNALAKPLFFFFFFTEVDIWAQGFIARAVFIPHVDNAVAKASENGLLFLALPLSY